MANIGSYTNVTFTPTVKLLGYSSERSDAVLVPSQSIIDYFGLNATVTTSTGTQTIAAALDDRYRANNIIGTVSESGGVPTGAIFESGVNANGRYVKLPDGTVECWASITLTYNSAGNVRTSWNFPTPVLLSGRSITCAVSSEIAATTNVSNSGISYLRVVEGSTFVTIVLYCTSAESFLVDDTVTVFVKIQGRWY